MGRRTSALLLVNTIPTQEEGIGGTPRGLKRSQAGHLHVNYPWMRGNKRMGMSVGGENGC
eukprot:scaffold81934_cov24-Prasinocladus_malaysianus.AAC.1